MTIFADTSCLVCGSRRTREGFICPQCYLSRYGTIHARWTDMEYVTATQIEVAAMDKRNAEQLASRKRTEERRAA